MSRRSTISDLAKASGVSVSTVNRILNGSQKVRPATVQMVLDAAEQIGFYGLRSIESRKLNAREHFRLGFLLQQSHRSFFQEVESQIIDAAKRRQDVIVEPVVKFVDEVVPEKIAASLEALGKEVDAVALHAEDHPLISQAIAALKGNGKPAIAFISDQSAMGRAGYVGTDNWRLGRTAAWLLTEFSHRPGRLAVFIGNHRYQCQDIADASFRSYIREHAKDQRVDESRMTEEEPDVAYSMVRKLLREETDLAGIFFAGGGISGVVQALRETPPELRDGIRIVSRDMGPAAQKGLTEGYISASLSHPLARTSDELIDAMLEALKRRSNDAILQRTIPFEILTPENA